MRQTIFSQSITPRPYHPADQPAVLSLLANTSFVYRNLNWQSPEEALARSDLIACVGLHHNRVAGFLALSGPTEGISWLRIAALGQGVSRGPAMRGLWHGLQPQLIQNIVRRVLVLQAGEHFHSSWRSLNFKPVEAVVLMRLESAQSTRPVPPPRLDIVAHPARTNDLDGILALDHAAFEPAWWLQRQDLQAALATNTFKLAYRANTLVGYIIARFGDKQGHISRLATIPAQQGMGIGSSLLQDVLNESARQGVETVTVNTQASNTGSQRLYHRFGFVLTGEQWPVLETLVQP